MALAFTLFRLGSSVEDVMHQTKRTRSTVCDYLCEFIRTEKPAQVHFWVPPPVYDAIAQAARGRHGAAEADLREAGGEVRLRRDSRGGHAFAARGLLTTMGDTAVLADYERRWRRSSAERSLSRSSDPASPPIAVAITAPPVGTARIPRRCIDSPAAPVRFLPASARNRPCDRAHRQGHSGSSSTSFNNSATPAAPAAYACDLACTINLCSARSAFGY